MRAFRLAAFTAVVAAVVALGSGPASGHVTIRDPGTKGGF